MDGHKSNRGAEDQYHRETETEDRTGQRSLLARGMPDNAKKERRPPKQQHALNVCSHQGEEVEAAPQPKSHTYCALPGARGGPPDMAAHTPIMWPGDGGVGGTPHPAARTTRV